MLGAGVGGGSGAGVGVGVGVGITTGGCDTVGVPEVVGVAWELLSSDVVEEVLDVRSGFKQPENSPVKRKAAV